LQEQPPPTTIPNGADLRCRRCGSVTLGAEGVKGLEAPASVVLRLMVEGSPGGTSRKPIATGAESWAGRRRRRDASGGLGSAQRVP
jgi:hypothetical protein